MMHGRKNKENCALKLVDEIILYYDARSKKHQKRDNVLVTRCHVRVITFLRKRNNMFPFIVVSLDVFSAVTEVQQWVPFALLYC